MLVTQKPKGTCFRSRNLVFLLPTVGNTLIEVLVVNDKEYAYNVLLTVIEQFMYGNLWNRHGFLA